MKRLLKISSIITIAVFTFGLITSERYSTVSAENLKPKSVLNGGNYELVTSKTISNIKDINVSVVKGSIYALPKTVTAVMQDGSTAQVSVTWNPSSVDTKKVGKTIYKGTVKNYSKGVKLTLSVLEAISFVPTVRAVAYVGDKYALPTSVTAIMEDGNEQKLSVKWNTDSVNTDSTGIQTIKGVIPIYNQDANLRLNVQYKVKSVQAIDESEITIKFEGAITSDTMPEIYSFGENGYAMFNPSCIINKDDATEVDVSVRDFYAPDSYTLSINGKIYTVEAAKAADDPVEAVSAKVNSDKIIEVTFNKEINFVTRPYVRLYDEKNNLIPYFHDNESKYIYTRIDYNNPTKLYVILNKPMLYKANKYTLVIGDMKFVLNPIVDKKSDLSVVSIVADDEKSITINFNKDATASALKSIKILDKSSKEITNYKKVINGLLTNEININLTTPFFKPDVYTVMVNGKKYSVAACVSKEDIPQVTSVEVQGDKRVIIHFSKQIDTKYLYNKFSMKLYDSNKNQVYAGLVPNVLPTDSTCAYFDLDKPFTKPNVYTMVVDGQEFRLEAVVNADDLPKVESVEVTSENNIIVHYDKELDEMQQPSVDFSGTAIYGYSVGINHSDLIITNIQGSIEKGMQIDIIIDGTAYPITFN